MEYGTYLKLLWSIFSFNATETTLSYSECQLLTFEMNLNELSAKNLQKTKQNCFKTKKRSFLVLYEFFTNLFLDDRPENKK